MAGERFGEIDQPRANALALRMRGDVNVYTPNYAHADTRMRRWAFGPRISSRALCVDMLVVHTDL